MHCLHSSQSRICAAHGAPRHPGSSSGCSEHYRQCSTIADGVGATYGAHAKVGAVCGVIQPEQML